MIFTRIDGLLSTVWWSLPLKPQFVSLTTNSSINLAVSLMPKRPTTLLKDIPSKLRSGKLSLMVMLRALLFFPYHLVFKSILIKSLSLVVFIKVKSAEDPSSLMLIIMVLRFNMLLVLLMKLLFKLVIPSGIVILLLLISTYLLSKMLLLKMVFLEKERDWLSWMVRTGPSKNKISEGDENNYIYIEPFDEHNIKFWSSRYENKNFKEVYENLRSFLST